MGVRGARRWFLELEGCYIEFDGDTSSSAVVPRLGRQASPLPPRIISGDSKPLIFATGSKGDVLLTQSHVLLF